MKFPMVLIATALALGTEVCASPALPLPAGLQQDGNEAGLASTETSQAYVELGDINTSWLHFISGDRDDDDCEGDDRDDDDCDDDNHHGNASGSQAPSTLPQNGLFNMGKAPVVKTN